MARLLFVLAHSTDDPRRAAAGLEVAAAAAAAGHEVAAWLTDEGVRLAVRGVADALLEPGPRAAAESLEALAARGATLRVSRSCFDARGFEAEQLRPEARVAEAQVLASLVTDGWVPVPT